MKSNKGLGIVAVLPRWYHSQEAQTVQEGVRVGSRDVDWNAKWEYDRDIYVIVSERFLTMGVKTQCLFFELLYLLVRTKTTSVMIDRQCLISPVASWFAISKNGLPDRAHLMRFVSGLH